MTFTPYQIDPELDLERFGSGHAGVDGFAVIANGPTAIAWDLRTAQLSLTGTRLVDGLPAGPAELTADMVALRFDNEVENNPGLPLSVCADGTFAIGLDVPDVFGNPNDPALTWRLDVTLSDGRTQEIPLGSLPRGINTRDVEVYDDTATQVVVNAFVDSGASDFQVTPVIWDSGGFDPWELLQSIEMDVQFQPDTGDTRAVLEASMPDAANWFVVRAANGIERVFAVDPDTQSTVIDDAFFQSGSATVPISGQVRNMSPCPIDGGFVFNVEVIAEFDGGNTASTLDTFTVFPEPDGTFSIEVPVVEQPDATGYVFKLVQHPDYSVFSVYMDEPFPVTPEELQNAVIEVDTIAGCAM